MERVLPRAISEYALIGDCRTAALIHESGAIEWLCWPRFDSAPCLTALLGDDSNGVWHVTATDNYHHVRRRYRSNTLILETRFSTPGAAAELIDFMPLDGERGLFRLVRGLEGRMSFSTLFNPKFEGGRLCPRVWRSANQAIVSAGGVILRFISSRPELCHPGGDLRFTVNAGEEIAFALTEQEIAPEDLVKEAGAAAVRCDAQWRQWSSRCTYEGPWRDAVMRSLITLRALMYVPSGGMVAAPSASLPEQIGGQRNWDYRYCWLRDSTFTVLAMLHVGYVNEARAWSNWLLRAIATDQRQMRPFYDVDGFGAPEEVTADWLCGFGGSQPVRFGNAARRQCQLGVYGEVQDTLYQWHCKDTDACITDWGTQAALLNSLEALWREPDAGIWEQRGNPEYFTQSQAFAWLAIDRAMRMSDRFKLPAPVEDWRSWRDEVHESVCRKGFDPKLNAFTRAYGSKGFDASTLLIGMVGFLPADDPRIVGTVGGVMANLANGPFVYRYDQSREHDGVASGGPEGAFLPCSFWLADNLVLQNRRDEAAMIFEKLLGVCNDVGLLSEEYDPGERRLLGNFPQALTHLSLIHTALNLTGEGPAHDRTASY